MILALFLAFVEYEHPEGTAAQVGQYYKWLIDVEVMVFVGEWWYWSMGREWSIPSSASHIIRQLLLR